MLYSKKTDHKEIFNTQIFSLFGAGEERTKELTEALYARYTVEDFAFSDDSIYWRVFGYFTKVVMPHKNEVEKAGLDLLNAPWLKEIEKKYGSISHEQFEENLFLHDLSKFSANESIAYAFQNFDKWADNSESQKEAFNAAWLHHKNNNPHHPEYWLNANSKGVISPLPMPLIYVLEMVADWTGAGIIYGNTLEKWLPKSLHHFVWHEQTADILYVILGYMGFEIRREGAKLFCAPNLEGEL